MISARVAGIPCLVEVTYFKKVKPWPGPASTCPSSDDYYGYTDIEFEVRDLRGRPAPWLERKMSDTDEIRIRETILSERSDEH